MYLIEMVNSDKVKCWVTDAFDDPPHWTYTREEARDFSNWWDADSFHRVLVSRYPQWSRCRIIRKKS